MTIFFHEDINLKKYVTTEGMSKKKQSNFPTTEPQKMTLSDMKVFWNREQVAQQKRFEETENLLEGTKKVGIDDFNILKVIGRGAFGKVMLVEKKDTKKVYALKSLKKAVIVEKGQIEHTKTEKQILQNVSLLVFIN